LYQLLAGAPAWRSPVRDRNSRRILDATRDYVDQFGLEQLSMRRLANHIDISVRTLYNLFGDKRGLLAALVQHSLDEVGVASSEITATDPIERVWQGVTISVETMASLPKAVVLAVMSDEQLHDRLDWRGRRVNSASVQSAIQRGDLREDLPADAIIDQAGAVYRYILHLWATSKIKREELLAGVLHGYDVALLAVARPRARKRLLEHMAALGPAAGRWRQQSHPSGDPTARPWSPLRGEDAGEFEHAARR
jgi:AcrR family transcriptional regulator